MPPLNEYTIWLEPDDRSQRWLQEIIDSLSQKTDSVSFPPHVTLLGGLNSNLPESLISQKIEKYLIKNEPLTITLGQLNTSDRHYRTLSIDCLKTERLTQLNLMAQKIFDQSIDYQPHISLLYDQFDQDIKDGLLGITEPMINRPNITFPYLTLWLANGGVTEWQKVKQWNLESGNNLC